MTKTENRVQSADSTLRQRKTRVADPRLLTNFDGAHQRWERPAGSYLLQLGHSATAFQGQGAVTLPKATWAADASPKGAAQACLE